MGLSSLQQVGKEFFLLPDWQGIHSTLESLPEALGGQWGRGALVDSMESFLMATGECGEDLVEKMEREGRDLVTKLKVMQAEIVDWVKRMREGTEEEEVKENVVKISEAVDPKPEVTDPVPEAVDVIPEDINAISNAVGAISEEEDSVPMAVDESPNDVDKISISVVESVDSGTL